MNHSDNENEGIGIIAIIVLVFIAALGLYFLFSHRPPTAVYPENDSTIPLEAPAPVHEGTINPT